MAQKIRTEWYIREYRMKNGICEKTKFPVRVEGEHPNRTSREYKRQVRRAEKNATEAKNTAARIVNNNFLAGLDMTDLLTYSDEGMERLVMKAGTDGEDEIYLAAKHELALCIERARYACKKDGVELRYCAWTSDRDGNTGKPVRVHHHVIVNREGAEYILRAWKLGEAKSKKLYSASHGDLTDFVEYLMAQTRQIGTEKRYMPSRNLEAPVATRPRLAKNPTAELRLPKGCSFIWRSEGHAGRPQKLRYYRPGIAGEGGADEETIP